MELQTPNLRIRDLVPDDLEPLVEILESPSVCKWWPDYDHARVKKELFDEPDDQVWLAIEREGTTIGLIGYWEQDEPEYRYVGIDVTLHPDWHERGLGTEAVGSLARWLIEELGHHRVTIDPDKDNARAIRCYEKVGFKPVGVMRRYQKLRDGTFRDALLMDLLPEELTV